MLRKLFVSVLLLAAMCVSAVAQQTPESKKTVEQNVKPMVWSFQMGGESFLGVEPQEVTKENFNKFGLSNVRGVAVEKVVENSPAAKAGLQAGDVIIKFNGDEVTSVRKLSRLIGEVAPDHQAALTILRGGSESEITVTMGKREAQFYNGNFNMKMPEMPKTPQVQLTTPGFVWKNDGQTLYFGASRQIGVSTAPLTKQLGDYFGVAEGKGVLITNVREDSPAAKAGLKAGDIIVEVEGKEVKNGVDLIQNIAEKKEGDVTLTIIRDKNRQTVRVTPEEVKGNFTPIPEGNFQMTMPKIQVAPIPTNMPKPAVMPKVVL